MDLLKDAEQNINEIISPGLILTQPHCKQVEILISKNQVLQMLCLKHHVYKTS